MQYNERKGVASNKVTLSPQEEAVRMLGNSNQHTIKKLFGVQTNEKAMLAIIWTGIKVLLTQNAKTEHDHEWAEFQNECFERLK